MGGGKGAPSPPDYGPIAAASEKSAELSFQLGTDQLNWAKQTYAENKGLVQGVVNSMLQAQNLSNDAAGKDRQRYEQQYQPLEDQLVQDAQSYASPERKNLEMGRAGATVAQTFDAARQNAQRQLEDFGINPGSTRYAALDLGARTQQAAATAGAQNQASQLVDATGRALRSEAINVGRGYPGQVAGTYSTALQAGSGAVNSTLATTASGANTMGTAPQYIGLGNQALNVWGNTLNNSYNNQLNAYKASQSSSSGIGSAIGGITGLLGMFMEDGGEAVPVTPQGNPGAAVPVQASPTGGQATDDVPAQLTVGEFVVPKDVVMWEGEKSFQKLIQKARQEKQQAVAKPAVGPMPAGRGAPTFVSSAPQRTALPMAA